MVALENCTFVLNAREIGCGTVFRIMSEQPFAFKQPGCCDLFVWGQAVQVLVGVLLIFECERGSAAIADDIGQGSQFTEGPLTECNRFVCNESGGDEQEGGGARCHCENGQFPLDG